LTFYLLINRRRKTGFVDEIPHNNDLEITKYKKMLIMQNKKVHLFCFFFV